MDEQKHIPLARYTTLKIGGEANRLCQPKSVEELSTLVEQLEKEGEPWFVLGGGSNLLISSDGFKGTVIRTALMTDVTSPEPNILEAAAGARLPHLAKYAAGLGLSGLEFAVGIPGTVGGAVIMNAGAHHSCIANILESATIYDAKKRTISTLTNSDLNFEYRRCVLDPAEHVVLSARFRMNPDKADVIQEITKQNEDYRWRTQPLGWPNAGSTFKNPEPTRGAGLLLDQAGAKNMKEGAAAVSAIHANFVINMGGASSKEVTTLMRRMQEIVFESFQINLKPEWKTLGTFGQEEKDIWRTT